VIGPTATQHGHEVARLQAAHGASLRLRARILPTREQHHDTAHRVRDSGLSTGRGRHWSRSPWRRSVKDECRAHALTPLGMLRGGELATFSLTLLSACSLGRAQSYNLRGQAGDEQILIGWQGEARPHREVRVCGRGGWLTGCVSLPQVPRPVPVQPHGADESWIEQLSWSPRCVVPALTARGRCGTRGEDVRALTVGGGSAGRTCGTTC
jgi:hypothetical protein